MREPPTSLVRQFDTHRLVPSRRDPPVLASIARDPAHLDAIIELNTATNDRLLAQQDRLPRIGIAELVFGVPCADEVVAE